MGLKLKEKKVNIHDGTTLLEGIYVTMQQREKHSTGKKYNLETQISLLMTSMNQTAVSIRHSCG